VIAPVVKLGGVSPPVSFLGVSGGLSSCEFPGPRKNCARGF
jgi:hypothetical protein